MHKVRLFGNSFNVLFMANVLVGSSSYGHPVEIYGHLEAGEELKSGDVVKIDENGQAVKATSATDKVYMVYATPNVGANDFEYESKNSGETVGKKTISRVVFAKGQRILAVKRGYIQHLCISAATAGKPAYFDISTGYITATASGNIPTGGVFETNASDGDMVSVLIDL